MSAGGVRVRRRRSRIGRSGAILVATAIAIAVAAILLATGSLSSVGGEASPASVSGSTLRASFADLDGDGFLERSAGEPLVDRTELAPAATPGRELALFAQLSDAHVRDEESPARAVQVDRLGSPVTEAFRPQEALSAQTMAAAVSSLNALAPDAVVVSGDLIDSAQRNELNQALSVLEGGSVEPDSGARGYDGPQAASSADPFIYRPDVDAPTHPGLLEAAQQPFRSPGLDAPWYPVLGNHELLVQGEAPVTAQLERISVGGRRLVELDTSQAIPQRASDAEVLERALSEGLPGRTRATPADPARRYLTAEELIGGFGEASGLGGSAAGATRAQDGLDYHFDVGPDLRLIVLDLVRRTGGSSGRVTGEQVAWLRGELRAADERWIVIASH
ncbi:MAG: hypothetical protein H0W09_00965, partial [Solirubrobacterales bacterium]|nr:hypothetical protein [Solirubrobacterales bacterium]